MAHIPYFGQDVLDASETTATPKAPPSDPRSAPGADAARAPSGPARDGGAADRGAEDEVPGAVPYA